MITETSLYWITRLDAINVASSLFGIISGIIACSCLGFLLMFDLMFDFELSERKTKQLKSVGILSAFLTVVFMSIAVFMPTTQEMCVIKVVPAVANSEQAKKALNISDNLLKIAENWTKEQLKTK